MPISPTSLATAINENATEAKNVTLEKLTEYVAYTQPPSPTNSMNGCDDESDQRSNNQQKSHTSSSSPQVETNTIRSSSSSLPIQPMSTRLPTMWLGGQNGVLYVHSAIAQWSHCIATIHLPDSILHIVHYRGRVFVALANGQCCIFYRCEHTGELYFILRVICKFFFLLYRRMEFQSILHTRYRNLFDFDEQSTFISGNE